MSSIIYVLYQDIRTLIIGKMFTSMLGYNQGGFPSIVRDIDGSIQSVMFPLFLHIKMTSKNSKYDSAINTTSSFGFPAMMGLAVVAEPLVKLC